MKQNPNTKMPDKIYKVYTALITQNSTENPIATILHSDIGTIIWTRDAEGTYTGTLTGAFTEEEKIYINIMGYGAVITTGWADINSIYVLTHNSIDMQVVDNKLYNSAIEIRIYS